MKTVPYFLQIDSAFYTTGIVLLIQITFFARERVLCGVCDVCVRWWRVWIYMRVHPCVCASIICMCHHLMSLRSLILNASKSFFPNIYLCNTRPRITAPACPQVILAYIGLHLWSELHFLMQTDLTADLACSHRRFLTQPWDAINH